MVHYNQHLWWKQLIQILLVCLQQLSFFYIQAHKTKYFPVNITRCNMVEHKAKIKGKIHDSAKHLSLIHYWGMMSGFELPTFVMDNHCALITVDAFEMESNLNPPYFQGTNKQHDIYLWILTPDILHMTKLSILFSLTVIWNIVVAVLTSVLSSLTGKESDSKAIKTWCLCSCACSGCYLAARLGPSFLWDLDRFCLSLGLL